ncbi:hypothetical protein C1280_24235 [Gemmata obscuriglobus]|uniref:Uncharacterized protein n=1 Tax=Gemmata obscuriglobus TaxID=114 RepID=A0A2Z3H8F3_9BACT|nr:hypothetical protein C1280_24235 [Gemmata obscuriglobus]
MYFDGRTRIVTPLERFSPCTLEAWVWPEEYTTTGTQAVSGDRRPAHDGRDREYAGDCAGLRHPDVHAGTLTGKAAGL